MAIIEAIQEPGAMTHMPFLIRDRDGRLVLFYCRSGPADFNDRTKSRRWKLWVVSDGGPPRRVLTGLSEASTECSPTAWYDASGWHVTFIAGGDPTEPRYHLYRMDGPTLDQLAEPVAVQPTHAGFIFCERMVYAELKTAIHVRQPSGGVDIELPGAFIYRVAYRADAPEKLLISGQWLTAGDVFTIEHDLTTGARHTLKCDGLPAYKCAILGDRVYYAQRMGGKFEDRRIVLASRVERRPMIVVPEHVRWQ